MTIRKKATKKTKVPARRKVENDITRLKLNEKSFNTQKKKASSAKKTAARHRKSVVDEALDGKFDGRIIPVVVAFLYILLSVAPNEIGYRYYLEKSFDSTTTFGIYVRVCGAFHTYDVLIAAVVMFFLCRYLWKRGTLKIKGSEDPLQDRIASCILTFLVYTLGVFILPHTFYMTIFQINHLTADPVSKEVLTIKEAGTETPMFSHKENYYFILDVDGVNYKVYVKKSGYERYQNDSVRTVRVEWNEGFFGYRFIGSFWLPKANTSRKGSNMFFNESRAQQTVPVIDELWHVKKDGQWYKLRINLRLYNIESDVRREIAKGLFGIDSDSLQQAKDEYLRSFSAIDSTMLVSREYPLIEISLMGNEFGKQYFIRLYAEKSVTHKESDVDFLYDKSLFCFADGKRMTIADVLSPTLLQELRSEASPSIPELITITFNGSDMIIHVGYEKDGVPTIKVFQYPQDEESFSPVFRQLMKNTS